MRSPSSAVLSLCATLLCGLPMTAQTILGDIEPYLMDRSEEIALARSAAPWDLGAEAAVWVLTPEGYHQAEAGSNGFSCFVGRGWSGPIQIGPVGARQLHPDLLDPELRAPHCFNREASRTVLPMHLARTRALLDGVPAEELNAHMERQIGSTITLPGPGAMAYMMSSGQDLGDRFASWRPHVMIYLPRLGNADWGIEGFTNDYPFIAESDSPWAVAVLPMRRYSDGSWAPETVSGRHH